MKGASATVVDVPLELLDGTVQVLDPSTRRATGGTRRARVLDPEGHEWSAGTYRPGSTW